MSRLCTRCRHPKALHGNGNTPCRAVGCSAGPEDRPCPAYQTDQIEQTAEAQPKATAAA